MRMVFEALSRHASENPDATAFRDDTGAVTWHDLSGRVAGLAQRLEAAPRTVAIAVPGGIDYVVADLALTLAGKRQVPLPFFFSPGQTDHILQECDAEAVITTDSDVFAGSPFQVISPRAAPAGPLPAYPGGAERVIYTSGSSGHPKGVIIGDRQLDASLAALSDVIGAGPRDRHLSVLPLPQLLEQICGIFLPILAGAECVMRFDATRALLGGPIEGLIRAMDQCQPTTSLLAPGLLGRWVAAIEHAGSSVPSSLRFVAVGGAASSPALVRSAEAAGIPVHEGYGLSECCSVVAMNRPGRNVPGTVGPVLACSDVQIVDGEITVAGPTVMEGYLGGAPAPARWCTGDLGRIEDGRLVVEGRKDALLVTPAGRNISPEWVEARVNADPRVTSSALCLRDPDGVLVLIAVLAAPMSAQEVAARLRDLPGYARPEAVIFTDPSEPGLLFPAGTPDRRVAAAIVNGRAAEPLPNLLQTERLAS
jgi:long-subunit acyl-CoA synthetase (AMP-forming)